MDDPDPLSNSNPSTDAIAAAIESAHATNQQALAASAPVKRRHKKKLPVWAHPLLYGVARAAAGAINVAGIEPSMRFMRRAGGVWGASRPNRRRLARAIDNIRWCFPDWPKEQVRDYAIESYRHLACLGAELVVSPRLLSREGYAAHVELGDLSGALEALCSDRPCLMITGHCGNWELLGATLAGLGFNMHALYRPLDFDPLDKWLHETRSRQGLDLLDKFGAADILPGLMERREPVGFIADQNAGDRGIFVPFFNRLSSAYKTIGLLAMKYDATVICGHARRLSGLSATANLEDAPRGGTDRPRLASHESRESQFFRYRIEIVDIYGPDDWNQHADPLFYITARYRRAIETMVRRAPEQYLWMHRYWKSRPPHERRGSPFPGQLREKIASLPWIDDDDVAQIEERSAHDAEEYARQHAGAGGGRGR